MKKLIDIPDEIVREMKIAAAKSDTNLKSYIQEIVKNHRHFCNITEMAAEGIEDGQSVRFVWHYLIATYEGIENQTFDYGSTKFLTLEDFILHVKEVCEEMLHSLNNN
jgi:hypothetical protein